MVGWGARAVADKLQTSDHLANGEEPDSFSSDNASRDPLGR
jgi:hypothetical protein